MAAYDFTPVTYGPRTATEYLALRAAAILTGSYVPSNEANVIGYDFIVLHFDFTIGSLTSVRYYVEGYNGVSWQPLAKVGAQSGGYSPVTDDLLERAATGGWALPPISCLGFHRIRVSAIGNGTATGSSLTIGATAGCYVGHRS